MDAYARSMIYREIMTQTTEDMKKELGEEFDLQYRKGVPSGTKNRYRPSA